MKQLYIIRLDDACSTMNREKWSRVETILDKYGIRALVGVVPHNEDPALNIDKVDDDFWDKVKIWQEKGWCIAMHGFSHVYISQEGGINPFWNRSEFAGVSLELQSKKIENGVSIMRDHGINPKYFFAPSHTFDENTIIALKEKSDIFAISDTISRFPYKEYNIFFVPQVIGHCTKMPFRGIYTFCLHPNIMNDFDFMELESFVIKKHNMFICIDDIDFSHIGNKPFIDKVMSWSFFTYRKLRGLR